MKHTSTCTNNQVSTELFIQSRFSNQITITHQNDWVFMSDKSLFLIGRMIVIATVSSPIMQTIIFAHLNLDLGNSGEVCWCEKLHPKQPISL